MRIESLYLNYNVLQVGECNISKIRRPRALGKFCDCLFLTGNALFLYTYQEKDDNKLGNVSKQHHKNLSLA